MEILNVLDTSAVLNGALEDYSNVYISSFVLSELENIKSSRNKDDSTKAMARKVIKYLAQNPYASICFEEERFCTIKTQFNYLPENNDGKIIAEAVILLSKYDSGTKINFITSDLSQYNIAKQLFGNNNEERFSAIYYVNEEESEIDYCGWDDYHISDKTMEQLYTNMDTNILECFENQYAKIYEEDELKDILRWDGYQYRNLTYKPFKSQLGEKITPRNVEQKMLFDLLQNRDIPIKLCLGRFGSGKSYLMLAHAMWLISQGKFDKIVFVRNNIEVKDAGRLGFLPGEQEDKMYPYIAPIADHIGPMMLEDYLNQDIIEPIPLGFIRGRDIKNAIIFCDEAENMTKQHIQLLIGRVSSGSELWLAGDLKQTDSITFEKNSGIRSMVTSLAGDELFGMVKLIKSERSATAAKADLMD